MATTAILKLTTPEGRPFELMLDQHSTEEEVLAVLRNAGALGKWLVGKGCSFAEAQPALAAQKALASSTGPTFAGFACSYTVDAQTGFPSWIMSQDGRQAEWHSRQGDNWFSIRTGPGKDDYERVLTIRKGEKVPPVLGLPG